MGYVWWTLALGDLKSLGYTTSPTGRGLSRWQRTWQGEVEVGPSDVSPGSHDFTPSGGFTNPRHAERYHDAALAAGYESELIYFSDGGSIVRVRKRGTTDPGFLSDR